MIADEERVAIYWSFRNILWTNQAGFCWHVHFVMIGHQYVRWSDHISPLQPESPITFLTTTDITTTTFLNNKNTWLWLDRIFIIPNRQGECLKLGYAMNKPMEPWYINTDALTLNKATFQEKPKCMMGTTLGALKNSWFHVIGSIISRLFPCKWRINYDTHRPNGGIYMLLIRILYQRWDDHSQYDATFDHGTWSQFWDLHW